MCNTALGRLPLAVSPATSARELDLDENTDSTRPARFSHPLSVPLKNSASRRARSRRNLRNEKRKHQTLRRLCVARHRHLAFSWLASSYRLRRSAQPFSEAHISSVRASSPLVKSRCGADCLIARGSDRAACPVRDSCGVACDQVSSSRWDPSRLIPASCRGDDPELPEVATLPRAAALLTDSRTHCVRSIALS